MTPRVAGHDSRQPTPPRWLPSGCRRLLPPAPWPPACLGSAHPCPVDLGCLGDETDVFLSSLLGDSEAVGLAPGEGVSAWVSADGDDLSSSVFVSPPPSVLGERRARRLRLQLKQRWKRVCPAVKLRCGLKAVHPDVTAVAGGSDP